MQALSRCQDGGHGNGRRAGHRHIPQHRQRAQAIGAKRSNQAGGGDLVLRIGFPEREWQLRGEQSRQPKAQ